MPAEIYLAGLPSGYELEHLARVFFPGAAVAGRYPAGKDGVLVYARAGRFRLVAGLRQGGQVALKTARLPEGEAPKTALARLLYALLRQETGLVPPWGMLTGVRPVRLLRNSLAAGGEAGAKQRLLGDYDVSPGRYALARRVTEAQAPALAENRAGDYSLYVSIPFCPSRCSYCSFVSQAIEKEAGLLEEYLQKLEEELALTAAMVKRMGLRLRTVYMGGGTPTVLSAGQMERLLACLQRGFAPEASGEYTVEAGRPDCTSYEKLQVMKAYGVGRISVNPQSMNPAVLAAIGRRHGPGEVRRCFEDARRAGFGCINMDVIAGLPGDDPASFAESLRELIEMAPENLTVHTLTLKRGSRLLAEEGRAGEEAAAMLDRAYPALQAAGYHPYYLYRQKNTQQNLENTGWTKKDYEGRYNIYIMEEVQTIISVGAGGVTKLVAGQGAQMKRVFNDKYPLEYLRNFPKVVQRKQETEELYAGILDSQEACGDRPD